VAENSQSRFFSFVTRAASAHLSTFDVEKRSLFVSVSRIFWLFLLEFSTLLAHVEMKKTRVILTAHANYLIGDVFSDAITQYERVELKYIRFRRMWKFKQFFLACTFFSLSFAFACNAGHQSERSSRPIKVNLKCILL
jgi:hypothetical protein